MDSKTAKKIKSKNTLIERLFGKAMWAANLRYRKHCKDVFGNPDFCFRKKKIAIFCDSEFWHGKKYLNGEKFKKNADFWESKIQRNIERDMVVNTYLENDGWVVIRFWDRDIKNSLDECIKKVILQVKAK